MQDFKDFRNNILKYDEGDCVYVPAGTEYPKYGECDGAYGDNYRVSDGFWGTIHYGRHGGCCVMRQFEIKMLEYYE